MPSGNESGAPARTASLVLLAVIAVVLFLDWAEAVFIPLTLALVVSYALAPLVDRLEKLRVPRALSAAVLLLAVVIGAGAAALSLREEAAALLETLPDAAQKIQQSVRKEFEGPGDAIENVQRAAEEIARATEGEGANRAPPGVTRVQVEKPKWNIREYLLTTAAGAISAIGIGTLVLFLAYFLLASGDAFRRKWVTLSGPTLSRRKITIQVLDEIGHQVKRYLAVQFLASAVVGIVSWLAFWAVGLENAAVWGILGGVLNLVPYVGAIFMMAGTALVAFYQFGTIGMALAVGGISLVLHALQNWLTPWLVSRASRMNAVVVFAGLLFWGWLWGAWGLLLGLPIMLTFKAICDHVEDLKPIGEFMGEDA
jgi:predicted PurR-regulated permease PerM